MGPARFQGQDHSGVLAHELFNIEGSAVLEHEVDGAAQLIGHDGVGLELSFLLGELLVPGSNERTMAAAGSACFPMRRRREALWVQAQPGAGDVSNVRQIQEEAP